MTRRYLPMLAKSAEAPFSGNEWLFEVKWDGIRAVAYVDKPLSIRTRNDREIAGQFPELGELADLAPGTVLDGEIVAMNAGRPDIQAVLPRLQSAMPSRDAVPVSYIVFDILEWDGRPLIDLPLEERREILRRAVREGPHVTISEPVTGRGEEYYRAAVAQGLEGVMAKRKDGKYEPGVRSGGWLKIKELKSCDCVIAGYTPGQGGRGAAFGALLLGLYDEGPVPGEAVRGHPPPGRTPFGDRPGAPATLGKNLVYIGKVGAGFRGQDLSELMEEFSRHPAKGPVLDDGGENRGVVWLEPVLVCEVAFQQVTRDRRLRIPRFIRLRPDKPAGECTTEQLRFPAGFPARTGRAAGAAGGGIRAKAVEESMKKYQKKRDFSRTGEPEGAAGGSGGGNYFVIQEHHAHRLHYDLRLERDGVLKSWAVPKGVPEAAGEKHLAVAVEDHPLEYGRFEGEIPSGEYGAGTVAIWDNGTYDTKHWDEDKIEFFLHGRRLAGPYVLVKFKRAGKNEWLVFRAGE